MGEDLSSLRRKVLSQEDKEGESNTVSQRKKNHAGESFSSPPRPPSLFVTSIPKLWRQRREREMQPLCTRLKPPPPPPPPRRRARIEAAAAAADASLRLCAVRGAARGLFALRPPLRRTPLLVIPPCAAVGALSNFGQAFFCAIRRRRFLCLARGDTPVRSKRRLVLHFLLCKNNIVRCMRKQHSLKIKKIESCSK